MISNDPIKEMMILIQMNYELHTHKPLSPCPLSADRCPADVDVDVDVDPADVAVAVDVDVAPADVDVDVDPT